MPAYSPDQKPKDHLIAACVRPGHHRNGRCAALNETMAANAPTHQSRPLQPTRLLRGLKFLLAGILMATAVAAQDDDPNHGVVFIYPTNDQIYNKMDTVNVTYTSPFPTPNLYLWCSSGDGKITEGNIPSRR